jgi:uncharacterized protein YdeI (YjbR/CyaY-like superfamily)
MAVNDKTILVQRAAKWKEEFEKLREILLGSQLQEDIKWGWPCYSYQKNNIVLIHGFRDYCALLFFKGALLKDSKGILIQQTENVQAARQIRFTNVQQILKMEQILKTYIREAIEVDKAGKEVKLKKVSEYNMPEELRSKLKENPAVKKAFQALTPGRQRAYLLYISQPKQSITRESRVEKCIPQILKGKGLND